MHVFTEVLPLKSDKLLKQILDNSNINCDMLMDGNGLSTTIDIPFSISDNAYITDTYHRSESERFIRIFVSTYTRLTLEKARWCGEKLIYDSAILDSRTYSLFDIRTRYVGQKTNENHNIIASYKIKKINGKLFLYMPMDYSSVTISSINEMYVMKYFKGCSWLDILKRVPEIIDVEL